MTESKGGTGPPKQPCPLRTVTQSAAQVASQQSLILRTGIGTNTTSPSPSSNGRRRSFSATRAPGFFALLDHAERAHVRHFCVVRPCRVSSVRSSREDVTFSNCLHCRRGPVAENCVWAPVPADEKADSKSIQIDPRRRITAARRTETRA